MFKLRQTSQRFRRLQFPGVVQPALQHWWQEVEFVSENLCEILSVIFLNQFGELNDLVGQKLLKSKGLPSSSLSMKSILWETSSWTASMWSSRLIRHCWCCLLLSEASPESLTPSSLFSVCDHEPPNEAWTVLREKNGRIYLQSTWELYKDLLVNVFTLRKNKVYDGVILNYIINQKGPVQLRSNAHMRWVNLRNADKSIFLYIPLRRAAFLSLISLIT